MTARGAFSHCYKTLDVRTKSAANRITVTAYIPPAAIAQTPRHEASARLWTDLNGGKGAWDLVQELEDIGDSKSLKVRCVVGQELSVVMLVEQPVTGKHLIFAAVVFPVVILSIVVLPVIVLPVVVTTDMREKQWVPMFEEPNSSNSVTEAHSVPWQCGMH
ncbi:hypothetical protein K439DRAFT_1620020 [Ramaria rubella]|nr:hypothetical protein K439DRAFT_1620020 [Ramaria rubella]